MNNQRAIETSKLQNLYERDYYLWLQETSRLLRNKDFTNLDLESLIEEIESLGKRERNKLISSLRLIYQHLL